MISCHFLSRACWKASLHVFFYENIYFSTLRAGKACTLPALFHPPVSIRPSVGLFPNLFIYFFYLLFLRTASADTAPARDRISVTPAAGIIPDTSPVLAAGFTDAAFCALFPFWPFPEP